MQYTAFLLFITDGETNGDIFLLDNIFTTIPTGGNYSYNNLNNKISIFMLGDTGYLSLAVNGKSFNDNSNAKIFSTVFKRAELNVEVDVSNKIGWNINDDLTVTFTGNGLKNNTNLSPKIVLEHINASSTVREPVTYVLTEGNNYTAKYKYGGSSYYIKTVEDIKATYVSSQANKFLISGYYSFYTNDEKYVKFNLENFLYSSLIPQNSVKKETKLFLNLNIY